MKLKVCIVVLFEESIHFYPEALRRLFEDHIDLEVYLASALESISGFHADVVLYTVYFLESYLRSKCTNPQAFFFHMGITIRSKSLDALRNLERGSDVLLVSEGNIFLWDTLFTLKYFGIDHVNFIPYYGQKVETSGIRSAVYMGIKTYKFPQVQQEIDIGWRVVHPYVLRKIAQIAALSPTFVQERIRSYVGEEDELLSYEQCTRLALMSEFTQERLELMNLLDYPAVLLDDHDVVYGFNESFRREFQRDLERMIGNKIYRDPLLTDLRGACVAFGGTGIYHLENGGNYSVLLRQIENYGQVHYRILMEIKRIKREVLPSQAVYRFEDLVYTSSAMEELLKLAKHFADTQATILIEGESGTGKELLAHSIHGASRRHLRPFLAVNCGAFSENLLESELFGYTEGSFTGALRGGKKGLLEAAHEGTIFLDEIGEASLKMQVRLLRFLQEKEVQPVGSPIAKKVDVRVICATNIDLEQAMEEKAFREDLYYRISPVTLSIPPLRERTEDIPDLFQFFLGSQNTPLSPELQAFLLRWDWPGNARELKGCAEYMSSFGTEKLDVRHLPDKYKKHLQASSRQNTVLYSWDALPAEMKLGDLVLKHIQCCRAGRRRLVQLLKEDGIKISEYRVQEIIQELKEQGLVHVGTGRGALRLTEKGSLHLELSLQREGKPGCPK